MTTRIHRFDFNTLRDFRGPIALNTARDIETIVAPAAPPPPVFSEQDLEAARMAGKKQGYSEGFAAGQQEAKRAADQKIDDANQVIAALGDTVATLSSRYHDMLREESRYLSKLVLSVAQKVAGEAIEARGEETICAIIDRCIPVIFSKPRLIIELNPDIFDRTLTRIETYLRDNGFEGEIQFKANPEMGNSDVHLDWGTGQVNHSATALWQEIEALIERVPLELTFADTLTNNNSTGENDGR